MDFNRKEELEHHAGLLTGKNGFVIVEDGGTVTGEFCSIQSLGAGGELGETIGNTPDLTGRILPQAMIIAGRWSSISAASGATNVFICYNA